MKIRSDFVSNSSSSSFIIADDKNAFVRKFKLTKQDFVDAIIDLSGGKDEYEKHVAEHKYKGWDGSWFHVYDKKISADKKILNSESVNYLKEWQNCVFAVDWKTNELFRDDGWTRSKYNQAYEALRDVYDLPWNYDVYAKTNWIYKYDSKTKKSTKKKVPTHIDKVVRDLYRHYGVLTNYDVLMMKFSRFLFRFGDNDIYRLKDMQVPGKHDEPYTTGTKYAKKYNNDIKNSIYETDSHSIQRVCEVLFNWFKANDKLPGLKDETWQDLYNDVVAVTMHEG